MRTARWWMLGVVVALVAGPLWGQAGLTASVATLPVPTRVHFDMTATPPVPTPEQLELITQRGDRGPLPHATPLPDGLSAVARPDSLPAGPTEAGGGSKAVPGTFTLFTNTSLGATIQSQTSGLTGEPTLANSGPIVFATGNWWAAISSDGGQTFSFISPFTQFPASFGGFCCDQMAIYDPSRDIFIWTLQYVSSGAAGAGQNLFRVAVARPSDAVQGNWWYYDFPSAVNTEWDFPGLCLSNDFAYYFTNRGTFNSGSVNDSWLFRFPLDPLSVAGSLSYNFIDFGASGFGNRSWRCANGSRDVLYFAAHNSTSQVRIMNWPENSGSLSWNDVNLSAAWPNATHACPTPDGRDWCGFDDGRIKAGWVGRNKIGFLWNASAGGTFPVPYVEGMRVVESTRAYLDRPLIWSSAFAFQYPAAAVNARGDVGLGVHGSSSTTYPAFLLAIDDDFSRDAGYGPPGWEAVYVRIGTQGPNTNRWGDYFSVQPSMPGGLGWTATGTTMQGCGGAGCKETRYVLFGRERDMRGIADPPVIYSTAGTTFVVGVFGTFTAMAKGFPAPNLAMVGTLPSGVTFDTTTGLLSGTPASGTGGVYPLTLNATNGVLPNDSQSFTLTVNEAPAITSANNTTFTVGSAGTFTVTATGYPAPTFTRSGTLPTGVSFNTTTGVLSGTPAAGTGGVYPLTIGAVNGVLPNASQSFTLTVNQAPAITSTNSTTFTVGSAGTFTVTATGYPAPTFTRSGALPTGVSFNTTTGVLSGTPAAGTGGTYPLTLGAVNGVLPNASQSFTLTVNEAPAITSANNTTFTVGTAGSFTVTATGYPAPTRSETGLLPTGVTFTPGTGALAGVPGAGTGGLYFLTFNAVNGVLPNAAQGFTLTVNEAPAITSPNTATCVIGTPCSFTVTASGFPASIFSETGALPFGMNFNTSTGVLSGVPGSSGTFPLALGATNGVAPNATQNFTLTVNTVASGAARSWVASFGADGNPCTLASPCRSFDRAISTTVANGEVVVLDSAGYGPATITQSITIVSPPGVHAGVSVTSGAGIVVNAGAGGRVVLRGLTINGQGGSVGVDFQSGAALYVEHSTITNFSTAGLNVAPSAGAVVYLRDVKVRDNGAGAVFSPTSSATGALTVEIDRGDFENNGIALSFEGKNTAGVIRRSSLSGGTAGVVVQPTVSGATAKVELRNSTISKNATVAVQAGSGAAGASATVSLVGVQLTGNGTGLLAQTGGALYVTDSTVTKNATGIIASGGSVTSLGDNRLVDNVSNGAFTSTVGKQ